MRTRGFTLIEVLVGAAVSLLVVGVVAATFLSQQRGIQALDLSREASNALRDATLSMQETLGRAGYGIDPRYAFDFRSYSCPSWSVTLPCRDAMQNSDEIVFVTRDPDYYWAGNPSNIVQGCDTTAPCTGHAWRITAFDTAAGKLTIAPNPGDTFRKGELVQIACAKGTNALIGTVASYTSPQITLDVDGTNANPYKSMIPASHDPCYDAAGLSLFLVSRYRYHVATVSGEPWLMLDRGIDYNGNGVTPEKLAAGTPDLADEIPIARGVEGLQIAYLLRRSATLAAPDNNGDWVIGNTPGILEEPDPTAAPPSPTTAETDPLRFNLSPANIRAVRVRLTVRSLRQDLTQPAPWFGDEPLPDGMASLENRNDFTAVMRSRFRRYFGAFTVTAPNMLSKNPFIF